MNEKERNQRVWELWDAGQRDPQYCALLEEMRPIERRYQQLLQTLSGEQQDVICDFVSLCEEMNWRILEIICEKREENPGA